MPVVVPDCPQLSSSLSLYSQKLKEKESSRAQVQVFEILKVSFKNQKKEVSKNQDEMIPESTSLKRKTKRVQNLQKEINLKPQNQNKEAYKNPKERLTKTSQRRKKTEED
jgi:hypothetical protein